MALSLMNKIFFVLISLSFFFVSCEPDPCRNTSCFQGSECVDGICFCLVGQYGDDCGSTYASDIAGGYNVISLCPRDTSFIDTLYRDTSFINTILIDTLLLVDTVLIDTMLLDTLFVDSMIIDDIVQVNSVLDTFLYTSTISTVTDVPWLIRISHPYRAVNDTVMMEGIFDADGLLSIQDSTINIDGSIVFLSGTADIVTNDSIILQMSYDAETCTETYYR